MAVSAKNKIVELNDFKYVFKEGKYTFEINAADCLGLWNILSEAYIHFTHKSAKGGKVIVEVVGPGDVKKLSELIAKEPPKDVAALASNSHLSL